jgi:energy-coupling factor transport system substrate-specific component
MQNGQSLKQERGVSKHKIGAALLILVCIPAVLAAGMLLFQNANYYMISVIVIALAIGAVALVFEGRRPQAKELVIIAVLIAVSVAGRAAFFMLPQFKPVIAMVIIAGVCLGGETGFIVGILSGFISNFIFGQGPATPFQMFGFGVIGFLAGALFRSGLLKKTRLSLCVYGGVTTLVIYGGLLDMCSLLLARTPFSWSALLVYLATGLPFNVIHASATVVFLLLLAKPMIEKIDRVKIKFGLMEPSSGKKGAEEPAAARQKRRKLLITVVAAVAAAVVFLSVTAHIPGFYGASRAQYDAAEEMRAALPDGMYLPELAEPVAGKLTGYLQRGGDGRDYYMAASEHTERLPLAGIEYLNISAQTATEDDERLMESGGTASYEGIRVSQTSEMFQANETRTPGLPLTTRVYASFCTLIVGEYVYTLEGQFFVAAGDQDVTDVAALQKDAQQGLFELAASVIEQYNADA